MHRERDSIAPFRTAFEFLGLRRYRRRVSASRRKYRSPEGMKMSRLLDIDRHTETRCVKRCENAAKTSGRTSSSLRNTHTHTSPGGRRLAPSETFFSNVVRARIVGQHHPSTYACTCVYVCACVCVRVYACTCAPYGSRTRRVIVVSHST